MPLPGRPAKALPQPAAAGRAPAAPGAARRLPGQLRLRRRAGCCSPSAFTARVDRGRRVRDHAGRHPAAGRGGGRAARLRRAERARLRASVAEPVRGRLPAGAASRASWPRSGPAGGTRPPGATLAYLIGLWPLLFVLDTVVLTRLAHASGRDHPARLVLGAPGQRWPGLRQRHAGARRRRSAISRMARTGLARGALYRGHAAQGPAGRGGLPGRVPAVQLRARADRPGARPDRQRGAARSRRPARPGQGGARPARARWARCTPPGKAAPPPTRDQLAGGGQTTDSRTALERRP